MLELEEIIAVWALRELKKKNRRKMWMHPIICNSNKKGVFWTIFEDLREKVEVF
jgi:hypothetical protein